VRIDDIRRIELGRFVRPAAETGTGRPRVEAVLGYVVRTPAGPVLLDTGMGDAGPETEAHYRPSRVPLPDALARAGVSLDEVALVVNCHLHFDHIGGNPLLAGRPVLAQRGELAAAREPDYTVPELVDFPGARYELLDGEAEIAPGVLVVPTPGHVDGHQSLVVTCADGTVVLAGQAHDTAAEWAAHAAAEEPSPWMRRLLALDPRRVVFAHDAAVWEP
jgi:N-acyl homoserine lactone hydrolase